MRLLRLVPAALILSIAVPAAARPPSPQASASPAVAQSGGGDWAPFISKDEGFSAVYPGAPRVETITYPTEYRHTLPGKVFTAQDAMGRYSTTVIDYRGAEKMHNDTVAACEAAKGADFKDGDACQNDFRVEVAGAMDFAAWNFMKRDGVRLTHYMWYFNEMVAGRLLQMTNPDQSRSFAVIHQHAGRLYIHQATVAARTPEPVLFMQNLGFVDEEGRSIRYTTLYTEGYGEWRFPHPVPPRTVRPLEGR